MVYQLWMFDRAVFRFAFMRPHLHVSVPVCSVAFIMWLSSESNDKHRTHTYYERALRHFRIKDNWRTRKKKMIVQSISWQFACNFYRFDLPCFYSINSQCPRHFGDAICQIVCKNNWNWCSASASWLNSWFNSWWRNKTTNHTPQNLIKIRWLIVWTY